MDQDIIKNNKRIKDLMEEIEQIKLKMEGTVITKQDIENFVRNLDVLKSQEQRERQTLREKLNELDQFMIEREQKNIGTLR
jgi:ethanolamine utilization protein EutA (predicted chaperonin)